MPTIRNAMIALITFALAVPVSAAPAETDTAIIRVPRPASATPAAIRQLRRQVAAAALEVCGASAFSLPDVRDAAMHSACWRRSYTDAIAQIGGSARADAIASPRSDKTEQP